MKKNTVADSSFSFFTQGYQVQTMKWLQALALLIFSINCTFADNSDYKIVGFGDSTTFKHNRNLVTYLEILEQELGVTTFNAGISGSTTGSVKENATGQWTHPSKRGNAEDRFQKEVLNQKPKLVIIQFGINDSAYRIDDKTKNRVDVKDFYGHLKSFVKELRKRQIKVILMTPNQYSQKITGHNDVLNMDELKKYVKAIRALSQKGKVPLVDIWQAYEDHPNVKELLFNDKIHPNNKGHRLVADLLIKKVHELKLLK